MPLGGCDCFLIDKQVIKKLLELNEANSSIILQILWLGFQTDVIYFHRLPRKKGEGKWTLSKKIKFTTGIYARYHFTSAFLKIFETINPSNKYPMQILTTTTNVLITSSPMYFCFINNYTRKKIFFKV